MHRLAKYLEVFILSLTISFFLCTLPVSARELYVNGRVTDASMSAIPDAVVTLTINSREFTATTRYDGSYTLRVSGLFPPESSPFEVESPYPNPFSYSTNIPVSIIEDGDLIFCVYDLLFSQALKPSLF